MDQITPKTDALNSNLVVTMTREDLRVLIRAEVQMAISTAKGASLNAEVAGNQKPYLTVSEAAEFARLATSTIRLYIRKGQLKAQKVGRRVIIERGELEAFLSRNSTGVQ